MSQGSNMLPRRHLAGAIAMLLSTAAAPAAIAQEPPERDEGETMLESVVVTGSRIRRVDTEQASPVTTVTRAQIDASGLTSVADVLQEIPAAGASLNQQGSAGTSFGAANINLRNLGANRVLVLVNGRRWVNTAGGRGFRDFVDLNSIPLSVVESIEVLKDGASSIYGSDAIAGVVNIITRRDIDGAVLRAQAGITEEGDGEQYTADFSTGVRNDTTSLLFSASVVDNQPIYVDDREISDGPLGALSLNTPFGRYVIPGRGTLTLIPGQPGTSPADFRTFNNATDRYNVFADTYLMQPNQRASIYTQLRHALNDSVDVVAEVYYTRRSSEQNFSEAPLTLRGSEGFAIPANHPFNPFGQALGSGSFQISTLIADHIQRVNEQDVDTARAMFGLEGFLANGWAWDVSYLYGASDATFTAYGQVNLDRIALGIGDVARCQAIAGCVPINLFGGPGSWTQQQLDWISLVGKDTNGTRLESLQANLTGSVLDMPAGPLGFAAGVEYREERAFDNPDALVNSTPLFQNSGRATTGAPREPTRGEYDLTEAYLEFNVPLLAERPWAERLELSLASRYSDYSTFGGTDTGKVGLTWKPNADLLVRATWSEGFRAPSIIELFAGRRTTNLPANDPCSGGGAGKPGCAGVPATYVQSGNQVIATVGSNPQLQPETSVSRTLGLVWSPSFLENFDVTVDVYNIEVEDAITQIGTQRILNDCAFALIRCDLITRAANGDITNVVDAGVNIASQEVQGVDFLIRYALPDTRWGSFRFSLDGSYLDEFVEMIPNPGANTITEDRRHGEQFLRESYPRWKAQLGTQWSQGPWSGSWRARYIHSMVEASARPDIGSVTYHDLQVGRSVEAWDASFHFGINNVFDKQPPISLVNSNINFDISTYDPRGRNYYVRAVWNF